MPWINLSEMSEKQIIELAAILVNEHGHAALQVAERRRDQHADKPYSDSPRRGCGATPPGQPAPAGDGGLLLRGWPAWITRPDQLGRKT